jgi:hypothetical protein
MKCDHVRNLPLGDRRDIKPTGLTAHYATETLDGQTNRNANIQGRGILRHRHLAGGVADPRVIQKSRRDAGAAI